MALDAIPPPASEPMPDLLLIWLSPSFPAGAFAFSHGLEKLVEDRLVATRADLESWLMDLAGMGSIKNDVILLSAAWEATRAADAAALAETADLARALQPSAERHLEATTQGTAFLETIRAAWPAPALALLTEPEVAYPVAVGCAAAAHGLPLEPTRLAYALAAVGNLVSAAIRLSLIGQTDGQRVTAALRPVCQRLAARALTEDDLGSAMFATDLASLAHETQYSRLFRS